MSILADLQHRRKEGDLGIEPLIDLTLHEAMQHERDQDRRDHQRDGDERAGRNQQALAERSGRARHHCPAVSL
ncbi:hypothetical protein [Rhodopseudomonas telluris]|uniref:Uncharacterized protein n=1 Tax=Rhodopseudomonas telluris TaxID=644215 RepID=A0ABV6ENF0_9BRAD